MSEYYYSEDEQYFSDSGQENDLEKEYFELMNWLRNAVPGGNNISETELIMKTGQYITFLALRNQFLQ